MPKSATDTMRDILAAAVVDAVMALKDGAKGLPNIVARDVAAIHPNTSVSDLPEGVQKALDENVRAAFARLKKEGYTVAESASVRAPARPGGPTGPRPDGPRGPRPGGPDGRRPPRSDRGDRPARPSGDRPARPGGDRPNRPGGPRPPKR